jgi:PD-(D/E)XK endonuclease
MEHPKFVGDRTALAVMLGLHEARIPFLVPLGENTRFDLVVGISSRFMSVQCKSGRLRGGAVEFATCSWYGHHPNPKVLSRTYADEIDFFAVYCRETQGVYLVPIGDVPTRSHARLRVEPPRNNQRRRIRLAADYEIAKVSVVAS